MILGVLESAFSYREHNHGLYGNKCKVQSYCEIDVFSVDSWTSTLSILETIQNLFETSITCVKSSAIKKKILYEAENGIGQVTENVNLIMLQLPRLAVLFMRVFYERLSFLRNSKRDQEFKLLNERLQTLGNVIFTPLCILFFNIDDIGLIQESFNIAEKFYCFKQLVELTFKLNEMIQRDKFITYFNQFNQEFANVFFKTCFKLGKFEFIFNDNKCIGAVDYDDKLQEFLSDPKYTHVSFLHSIKRKRYHEALDRVALICETEPTIQKRKFASCFKTLLLAACSKDDLIVAARENDDFISIMEFQGQIRLDLFSGDLTYQQVLDKYYKNLPVVHMLRCSD